MTEGEDMANEKVQSELRKTPEAGCDTRIWSGDCRHSEYADEGEKYLCESCGKIVGLTHEVRHEHFPHVSGDDDNLS
jgi:hypothetical protein